MGTKRVGLARMEALMENLKRDLDLQSTTLTAAKHAGLTVDGGTGAGLAGTGTAPSQSVLTIEDQIITTIKIDLAGLKKESDEGDVIGLASGGAAYLMIYNPNTHGVFHKIEISCVELPTGTNVLKDFDIISCDEINLAQAGDAAGATNPVSITAMAGNIALGQTYQDLTAGQPNASGDALYLCEGATSTNAQLYTAGMLIIRFYGSRTF